MPTASPDVPLRHTSFDNPPFNALGVECMALSDLMRRVPPQVMRVPERMDFYMLLVITAGVGVHMVDFAECALAPGAVVFVRPGQVQQWRTDSALEGMVVLVAAAALASDAARSAESLAASLAFDEWPAVFNLPSLQRREIGAALQQLHSDFLRFDQSAMDAALIRHGLRGILMRLARWLSAMRGHDDARPARQVVYRLFLRELEKRFRERQGVQDYAARLGFSESTLTRACRAAEGRSAKQLIDRRIALEAARELVHSQASVAEISHRLGFSEPTNFVKFFSRMQGCTPDAFRHKMRRRQP